VKIYKPRSYSADKNH